MNHKSGMGQMNFTSKSFEEILKENLVLYTSFSDDEEVSSLDLFTADREIAIARLALSNQAQAYVRSVNLLNLMLDKVQENLDDPSALSRIMLAIQTIENKSQLLIDSVQKVTRLLGELAAIDVDKAALRQMLVRLPSLVEDTISTLSQDDTLANRISYSLSQKIDAMMSVFRFSEGEKLIGSTPLGETNTPDLTLQYQSLLDSVPTSSSGATG